MKISDIIQDRYQVDENFDTLVSKLSRILSEAELPQKDFRQATQADLELGIPSEQEIKDEMAKLSPTIDRILSQTPPEEDTAFETKIDKMISAIPNRFRKARYALLRIRKLGIQNTTTQTVIMSILMAILNRAIVEFGMGKGWSGLGITVALEITLPAVAGYLYSWMQKAGTKKSFKNAILGGTLGGLAALGTVGIFGK